MTSITRYLLRFTLLSLLLGLLPTLGQSEGFTYQGRLMDGGGPANGVYDLQFRLFDALSGGTQVGVALNFDNATVTNGVFTVTLDFGSAAFPGAGRWLEVGVRPGDSVGAYTALSPNQPVTSIPYATQLLSRTGTISFRDGTTPLLVHTDTCCTTANRMIWSHSPAYPNWGIYYEDLPDKMHWRQDAGFEVLTVDILGLNVGIANASPTQRLDVSGNVRASGQLISSVATGSAPLVVSSATKVTNLNADLLDGLNSSAFATLGSNAFTGSQTVTGNITATGAVNAASFSVPAATRYLAIPCAAFVPSTNSVQYVRCSGNGNVYATSAGTIAFDAPVNLPHGAIITRVEALVNDSEAGDDLAVTLFRKFDPVGGFSIVTTVSSSGSPGTTTISSAALAHTVDNSSGAYHVRGFWAVPATPINLSLFLVRITYTVTSPLP